MEVLETLKKEYAAYASAENFNNCRPKELYEPLDYILSLGGKQMRPILLLLAADLFNEHSLPSALPAAYAIELFHNFSLIHDDIMDNASLRRGKATVHELYGNNTAILSGDVMLVYAYKYLSKSKPDILPKLIEIFNDTAVGVCEGQQMDMNFENSNNVSIEEYLLMIELKTSILLHGAMKIGALIAGADDSDAENVSEFARCMGIAFQLQDDYLDSFGDEKTFGKRIGGDIIQNKKTYLYLKAIKMADEKDRNRLFNWYNSKLQTDDEEQKIKEVKDIFIASGAVDSLQSKIEKYKNLALNHIDKVNAEAIKISALKSFFGYIMNRNH